MGAEFRVWVLDDNPANLRMIERSFPAAVRAELEVRSFVDAGDFLATFDALCRTDAGRLPDFILLDYFLGRMYGSQVLDHLLTTYRREPIPPAVIVAHSSMAVVSDSLVRAGADFALPKRKGGETSPPIAEAFGTVDALRWMKRHRRPLPPGCAADDPTSPA
jgi:CheY-like chemotaxis protein